MTRPNIEAALARAERRDVSLNPAENADIARYALELEGLVGEFWDRFHEIQQSHVEFDGLGGCDCFKCCGAAACYHVHNPFSCKYGLLIERARAVLLEVPR